MVVVPLALGAPCCVGATFTDMESKLPEMAESAKGPLADSGASPVAVPEWVTPDR